MFINAPIYDGKYKSDDHLPRRRTPSCYLP